MIITWPRSLFAGTFVCAALVLVGCPGGDSPEDDPNGKERAVGSSCAGPLNCATGVCTTGICRESTCNDGVRGALELGVDCGGPVCKKCDADGCQANTECSSAVCFKNKCAPADTKTCGVGLDAKCIDTAKCQTDADCTSDVCTAGKCSAVVPADHSDGRKNAGETGVDCGGPVKACVGDTCAVDGDCASALCFNLKCVAVGTKVCGAGFPTRCADSKPCDTDVDCTSDVCSARKCTAVTAADHADGRRNAGETGVDCGGSIKATKLCGGGQVCVDSTDCEGTCTVALKCTMPTHTDGRVSPSIGETDIDCGGITTDVNGVLPTKCRSTKACVLGRDCDSTVCTNLVCEARKPGRKDGDETDVDCGGGIDPDTNAAAARCQDAKSCAAASDCASAQCYSNKCVGGRSCNTADTAGITTCGLKESGAANKVHESCCRALPMPANPALRMGKYEVTAGRVRQFMTTVGPNLRAWAAAEILNNTPVGVRLAPQLPVGTRELLPASDDPNQPLNTLLQLGAGTIDKRTPSMVQGCYNGDDSYGHATYWQPAAALRSLYGPTFPQRRFMQSVYDEKSMNCAPYWIYVAFCAWDGGRLPTRAEFSTLWGAASFPWGNTRYPTSGVGNYETTVNWGNNLPGSAVPPVVPGAFFYGFPGFAQAGALADSSGQIAAPGRFPLDLTALRTPIGNEGWMDVGANLMETAATEGGSTSFCDFATQGAGEALSNSCVYTAGGTTQLGVSRKISGVGTSTWQGGSWEGHGSFAINAPIPFVRENYGPFSAATQYGKTGFRCVYPN